MADIEDLEAQLEAAVRARNEMGERLEAYRQRAEAAESAQQDLEADLTKMSSTIVQHRVAADEAKVRAEALAGVLSRSVDANDVLRRALTELVAGSDAGAPDSVADAIAGAAALHAALDEAGGAELLGGSARETGAELAAKTACLVADMDLARRALTEGNAAAAAQLARTAVAAIVCARPYAALMPDEAKATGSDAERELRVLRRAHEDLLVCLGQAVERRDT